MATRISRVTVHMVSSLDGFIAKKDGTVSWFETEDFYENGVPEESAEEFLKTVDCFVIGSRTYEQVLTLGWIYGDVHTVVVTHRDLPSDRKNIEFYSGDLIELVNDILKPAYKNIWVVGGASLARDFIRLHLADDIRLAILPVILGDGIPFLDSTGKDIALHLRNAVAYKSGMVELSYELKK